MNLYLAQHGDATPKEDNPNRPLSEKGKIDVGNVARFLSRSSPAISAIIHSGKLRAKQTAELLSEYLAPNCDLEIIENINPMDSPALVAGRIDHQPNNILLVGHLPHLAKLATLLLTHMEEPAIINFTPGTVACLERSEDLRWSLKWLLSPDMIVSKE